MKINKVIVMGCSWCWAPYDYQGGSRYGRKTDYLPNLSRHHESVFPLDKAPDYTFGLLLAKKLGVEFVNLAATGSSNMLCFMKLWDYGLKDNHDLSNTLVIHGFTEPSRTLVYDDKGYRKTIKPPPALQVNESMDKNWKSDTMSHRNAFFKNYYSEKGRIQETFAMLDFLNGYLINENSKLIVFNSFAEFDMPDRNYIWKKFKTWSKYIKDYDSDFNMGAHPNTYDHEVLADLLYNDWGEL